MACRKRARVRIIRMGEAPRSLGRMQCYEARDQKEVLFETIIPDEIGRD